ncbi:MAG: hypothetical protein ATN35_06385 [Epulopiscium sp. Nele67-Bin004]|nr:MAG: hypothetical protein ATN35_06385 [Epulopiscium sp. Nele67-Bin004]
MKIFHTSDWHIGKIVNNVSMLDDQKYVLNALIDIIDDKKPDVIIIAGDIYDRSVPPVVAVELLNEVLVELVLNKGIKVLAISGNHDSGGRIGFGSDILKSQGLYMVGSEQVLFDRIEIIKNEEVCHFYLVPYKDPSFVRMISENTDIKTHQDAMEHILELIKLEMDDMAQNFLVCHGYVSKISGDFVTSESEKPLAIGGTDIISADIFNDFDYVALGHLHQKQKIGNKNIYYSGSLCKYSFDEREKVVIEIDTKIKEVSYINLPIRKDFKKITGTLDELLQNSSQDYILATLTDEGELLNPIGKLREVYPNIMQISRAYTKTKTDVEPSQITTQKLNTPEVIFEEFYTEFGHTDYTTEKKEYVNSIIEAVMSREESR